MREIWFVNDCNHLGSYSSVVPDGVYLETSSTRGIALRYPRERLPAKHDRTRPYELLFCFSLNPSLRI